MSKRPYTVALTGGIASGKTSVSDWFSEQGIEVIDADIIAREVVQKGSPILSQIEEHFGKQVITHKGDLDRKHLGSIIFSNEHEREWLNNLLHPIIYELMNKRIREATSTYVLLVIPLLAESAHPYEIDRTILVDVSKDIQIKRLCERDNIDSVAAVKRIEAQASREERFSIADDIVENSDSLTSLYQQLEPLHIKYLLNSKVTGVL